MASIPQSGGGGAVASVFGRTGAVAAANNDYAVAQIEGLPAALAGKQAADADLTAIAAAGTAAYGIELLAQATAAAARTKLGLGTAATAASTAFDAAGAASAAQAAAIAASDPSGAAAAAQAASQPLDSDLTAIAALSTTTFGRALLALADAAAGRTALGLGTAATQASGAFDASGAAAAAQAAAIAASQPLDSDLTAIAALETTSFGRGLLILASAAKGREALEAAAAVHAVNHQIGGSDPLGLPQYDMFDLLPYVVPMEMYPGTTQAPVAGRAYFVRFTVSRKRVFKFVRWALGAVGTNAEEKNDAGIYVVAGGGTKLTRLSSSGAIKTSMLSVGAKGNEMLGTATCEPGIVYFVASGWETVTGTPQVLALLNNNGSVGDLVGAGTLSNRLMLVRNATFPLPEEVTTFTSSSPTTYMVPSEI